MLDETLERSEGFGEEFVRDLRPNPSPHVAHMRGRVGQKRSLR